MLETIEWTPQGVVMIDQTLLPSQTVFVTCTDYLQVASAIKTMIIRGAPAIGVAAAMGVAIGVQKSPNPDADFATIWLTGHLPGARNLPVDQVAARIDEVPTDRPLVVYCRSGRRSASASATLRARGLEVIDLGPMSAW